MRARSRRADWPYWAALAAVIAAGAFLRFYRIDALPLGFHYDEGLDAVSAHEIWSKGVRPIFFPQSGSREPLMIYLESFGILALGATRAGARIAQVFVGTGTVVAAWFLFRAIFNRRMALLATALMAVSLWHMFESRLGLRAISQPLVEALALLFLWRALERRRWPDALLAGAFLGLAQYTYTAARALPLVVALLVLWQALFSPEFVRRQWAHVLGLAGAALAVFAPLGWYAIHHGQEFFGRSLQVNLIAPEQFTGAGQAGGVGAAIGRTLGMFSLHGDPAWKYNVAGLPVFDWPVSALFYGGLVLAILGVVRWLRAPRKVRLSASPHLFALMATAVMLTPGFLSAEAPHFLRTIGVIPVLFIFPALGLNWLLDRLYHWPIVAAGFASLLLAFEGAQTGYRYFVQWATAPDAFYAMHGEAADVAGWLAANAGQTPVLFSSEYPGHPTLLYLAPKVFSQIRWFDGRQSLAFPPAGQDTLYVFTAHYQPPFANLSTLFRPDQLVAQGRDPSGSVAWQVFRSSTPPALAPPRPLTADLGALARLDGFAAPASIPAGQPLDVQEYWHAVQPGTPDVRAFLHLVDAQGHVWAQADNLGFYAEDWHPGDAAINDQRLAIPSWAPPLQMKLQFGLYHADSGQQLPIRVNGQSAGTELTLATVQIQPATSSPDRSWQPPHATSQRLAPGLTLIGWDLGRTSVQAGDSLPLDLYWRVAAPVASVPPLALTGPSEPLTPAAGAGQAGAGGCPHPSLRAGQALASPAAAGEGQNECPRLASPASAGAPPAGVGAGTGTQQTGLADLLPPPRWPAGVIEDRRGLTVPPTAKGGAATVTIGGVELGQVRVTEPNRDFALPAVQHELHVPVGDFARLTGYGLQAGSGELQVTLVWQATATTSTSYKGFVHLLDAGHHVLTQQDQLPQAGAMPTTLWLPGQVITDTYQLTLPPQVPVGADLEAGLYDPATGRRVDLGGQDHVLLPLSR